MLFLTLIQAVGSNLPQGDQEKCIYRKSTQQESFPTKKIPSDFKPFNQQEAVRKLRQTTFQLGDQRSPGLQSTTTLDSYPYPTMDGNYCYALYQTLSTWMRF